MNKTNNKRSQETKARIKETVLYLVSKEKSINLLTVKEICENCNINRSTFYSHYSIPEDVLKEIEKETLEDTLKYLSSIKGNEKENTILFLSYIKQKEATFRILFLKSTNNNFSNQLISQLFPIFNEIESKPYSKYYFNYIKTYAIEGAKSIIISWINNNFKENEKEIAELIIKLSEKVIDLTFSFNKQ